MLYEVFSDTEIEILFTMINIECNSNVYQNGVQPLFHLSMHFQNTSYYDTKLFCFIAFTMIIPSTV